MKAKKYAKVGKKPGRPAYRTPSTFKYQKTVEKKIDMAKKGQLASLKLRRSGLEKKKILEYNKNNK